MYACGSSLAAAEAFFSRAAEIYEETYFLHPLHHSEEVTRPTCSRRGRSTQAWATCAICRATTHWQRCART